MIAIIISLRVNFDLTFASSFLVVSIGECSRKSFIFFSKAHCLRRRYIDASKMFRAACASRRINVYHAASWKRIFPLNYDNIVQRLSARSLSYKPRCFSTSWRISQHNFQPDVYAIGSHTPKRMTRSTTGVIKLACSYASAMPPLYRQSSDNKRKQLSGVQQA